jgi:mannose-6-phosphate isomerase-like protein (cupin superfamily)
MPKRIMAAVSFTVLLALSIWAQRGAEKAKPTTAIIFTASDAAAMIAKAPKDKNVTGQAMIQLAPYNINMEHRIMGQAAAVHEKEVELFYVIEGTGTIVTGGKLVEEKRTNDANLSGTSIQGGVSKRISKGDWILVPEGVPHQIPQVEGAITVMSLHLPR